jgi:hypothetical protein
MKILRFKDNEVVTDKLIDARLGVAKGYDRIQLTVTQREQLRKDRSKRCPTCGHLQPQSASGIRIEVIG